MLAGIVVDAAKVVGGRFDKRRLAVSKARRYRGCLQCVAVPRSRQMGRARRSCRGKGETRHTPIYTGLDFRRSSLGSQKMIRHFPRQILQLLGGLRLHPDSGFCSCRAGVKRMKSPARFLFHFLWLSFGAEGFPRHSFHDDLGLPRAMFVYGLPSYCFLLLPALHLFAPAHQFC